MSIGRNSGKKYVLRIQGSLHDKLDEASFSPLREQILKKLNLPLDNWSKETFEIRAICDDENQYHHYADRMNALVDGVKFWIGSIPNEKFDAPYREQLYQLIRERKEKCILDLAEISENSNIKIRTDISLYQNIAADFTQFVIGVMQNQFGLTKQDTQHALARAEEFALAKKTRPAIVTITQIGNDEYIVLIDKPENPFSNAIKNELQAIQRHDETHYPMWFRVLKDYEKKYLIAFLDGVDLNTELGETINALSSKLRIVPVPANYQEHILITQVKNEKGEIQTITHAPEKRSSHAASRDVNKLGEKIRETHANNNVEKMIDDLIEQKIAEIKKIIEDKNFEEKIGEASVNENGNLVINVPILYQTLITPLLPVVPDSIKPDRALDDDKNKAVAYLRMKMANQSWVLGKNVEVKFDLISTNHPLNAGRYRDPTTSASLSSAEVSKMLRGLTGEKAFGKKSLISYKKDDLQQMSGLEAKILSRNPLLVGKEKEVHLLAEACVTLAKIINHKKLAFILGEYRELYLSSLEQIIVDLAGGCSLGSCVSGKDRKGIEIVHTDAMKIFYTKYNRLPPLYPETPGQKSDFELFSKIFAEVYCTRHQHTVAALNAPGAFGMKTPTMYLAKPLINAIQAWYKDHDKVNTPYEGLSRIKILREDDKRASNNEIKKIVTMNPPWYKRLAMRMGLIKKRDKCVPPLIDSEIYQVDQSNIQTLLKNALDGLATYADQLADATKKITLFSHHSSEQKEGKRISQYRELLGSLSPLNDLQKTILLHSIMKEHHQTQLHHVLLKEMRLPNREMACAVLASRLKVIAEQYVDKKIAESEILPQQRSKEIKQVLDTFKNLTTDSVLRLAGSPEITANTKPMQDQETGLEHSAISPVWRKSLTEDQRREYDAHIRTMKSLI